MLNKECWIRVTLGQKDEDKLEVYKMVLNVIPDDEAETKKGMIL